MQHEAYLQPLLTSLLVTHPFGHRAEGLTQLMKQATSRVENIHNGWWNNSGKENLRYIHRHVKVIYMGIEPAIVISMEIVLF